MDQLSNAVDETRHYTAALDSSKRKASELEKELVAAKSLLEAAQKELQEQGQQRAELELQLETERCTASCRTLICGCSVCVLVCMQVGAFGSPANVSICSNFRYEKRRLQEVHNTLSSRLLPAASHSEGGASSVEKLQEEIKEYKAILKCSVCHDRRKEVGPLFSFFVTYVSGASASLNDSFRRIR